jgi:hypothetical protein
MTTPHDGYFYAYYNYSNPVDPQYGCPYPNHFAVLGIRKLEATNPANMPAVKCDSRPSPGGDCPDYNLTQCRDWSKDLDYSELFVQ